MWKYISPGVREPLQAQPKVDSANLQSGPGDATRPPLPPPSVPNTRPCPQSQRAGASRGWGLDHGCLRATALPSFCLCLCGRASRWPEDKEPLPSSAGPEPRPTAAHGPGARAAGRGCVLLQNPRTLPGSSSGSPPEKWVCQGPEGLAPSLLGPQARSFAALVVVPRPEQACPCPRALPGGRARQPLLQLVTCEAELPALPLPQGWEVTCTVGPFSI